MDPTLPSSLPQVVIVGGGFGGLNAAKALRGAPVQVTVVDRKNHHLFQPLLYQVATAGLSPADIASPIRSVLRRQANTRVLLGDVRSVDLAGRCLDLGETTLSYDVLILAAGAETSYFGHPDWAQFAPGLKEVDDALEIRRRVLVAFEEAEREPDAERRTRLLTFVVIGGGPTGVELAGALSDLSRVVLSRDFRRIDPRSARIVLVEMAPRLLTAFDEALSQAAKRSLEAMGVEVRTGTRVERIDREGVHVGGGLIPSRTVLWGAGVRPTPLAETLGVSLDEAGRVPVEPDLSIPGHPEAFVIGDMAAFTHQGGEPLPGLAPVAIQQGRYVGRLVGARARGDHVTEPFRYRDKGMLATVGRRCAVMEVGRFELSGFLAWVGWLLVHILYLIGFRNRVSVLINWFTSYVTYRRGARLITGRRMRAGAPGNPDDQD